MLIRTDKLALFFDSLLDLHFLLLDYQPELVLGGFSVVVCFQLFFLHCLLLFLEELLLLLQPGICLQNLGLCLLALGFGVLQLCTQLLALQL